MTKIIFTVTNDLSYDQRMQRIAGTLAAHGYEVVLVGRKKKESIPLTIQNFAQKRLAVFFEKGFLFYAMYNLRLFFYLLFQKADVFCAIDLDTILPVYFASLLRGKKRLYDAHELFTEQKEVITRKNVHRFWLGIERYAVPRFTRGCTVNHFIAGELKRRYGVDYSVVRNLPKLTVLPTLTHPKQKWIIYQGAVNEGRCFETLIPAMQYVCANLVVYGKGNFYERAIVLTKQYRLEHKIEFRGYVPPGELVKITPGAYFGITLFEREGLNQYQSLANRFFDYPMAGIPQVCVNYPEYAAVNDQFHIMYPVKDTEPATLALAMNNLLADDVLYNELSQNCLRARAVLNWENEEKILLDIYRNL